MVGGPRQRQRTQNFGENENENHADKQARLLRRAADTSIADNADGKTGGETGDADRQTGAELDQAREEGLPLAEVARDEDGHDESVDGNDTSHNDRHHV
jgi:hypothetical protein